MVLHGLKKYIPKHDKYVTLKNNLVDNANNFYEGREKIIKGSKNRVFPLYYDKDHEEKMEFKKEQKEESEELKFFKYIENKSKGTSYDLFRKYFNFETPSQLTKKLFEIKDKKKNNDFVEESKSRWSKLKDEIEEIFEDTKKIEKPDKILKIVEEILNFNKQNQERKGLKILAPHAQQITNYFSSIKSSK